MVSKNNHQVYQQKLAERKQRWGIRKLSVGVASVLLGTTFMLYSNHAVLADTVPTNAAATTADKEKAVGTTTPADKEDTTPTGYTAQADSNVADHQGSEGTTTDKDTGHTAQADSNVADLQGSEGTTAPAAATTAPAAATTAPAAATTAPAARLRPVMKVAKAAPIAETPDPTTPSDSTSIAIVNDKNKLGKNWIQLDNGKAQIYFTVKGNDQKPYVTSFMDKDVKSTLYTKRFDPNSLELHIEYQNGDKDASPSLILQWDDKDLQLNTSRIGEKDLVYTTNSGDKGYVPLSPGNGNYSSYNGWLKDKQDLSKLHLISLWEKVPANSTFTATLPFKYVGNADVVKSTSVGVPYKPYSTTLTFDPFELHPEQIAPAPKPTTDDATTTTGVYNNPLATSSDWIKMVHGDAIAYYTAKGKDGKTYVTGYVAANGKSQSIINVEKVDLSTLEYHLIYHNGDKEVRSGLWANFADNKTIAIDTSRLGADGPQLKSQQGWSYKWVINGPKDGGIYYSSWAEYLKAHNNVGDQATNISMTGVAFKPDDTVELVIPVKYTGQLSARTPSLTFSPHINDYGNGFTQNWADLYFTTVKKDLSKIKQVDLLPAEFMGEQPGQSYWKPVEEISKDMPNGWDALKISNFPTYKGSFNMDSLPTGDLPSVVYGSAQYFIDLSEIQKIFAKHGYTVRYANNNGKAQKMPFYAYSTLPGAFRVDDDGKPGDPSIWVIHVQAVPAIILNKDQHYVADPNAKSWDPTSMIDKIYAADDAGQRKTRDQLEKLPKTDVDISYEYQAPGAATAAAVDKVDLTKSGVYTVTYSHTYADGQVVKDSRKVYVDDAKQETKDITRTIIVHTPNGTDQKVIQTATLTREAIHDATTGKIKSLGEWTTAKWEKYSAPEFPGYTPAPAQIDETTVNEDTQDITVEISYTANETPKQETKDITRTIIVHTPKGTDQTVIQKATLTREVTLYAPTGKIKSVGEWSTAKWEKYSAPEFPGYTPAPAQIDETTVNEDTQDITVEISYTANETPKQETKDITRTIIVHTPKGTDQTVIQTATLTREVTLYAPTGKIKSLGEWTTAKWEKYSAPEFPGYTPAPAQIDETTVNEDTQDITVEISYTANETPKQETKDITRTIIVHTPKGTDQTVIQKATLTREVTLYAPTGKIKSVGEWSTAKWEKYSAPEFPGYTPAPAQIDETTVNEDTQDTTVEISYTANKTPEQPDHNGKQETKDITRTIIVHEPNGTDQTVIQKATVTRKVILDATTGEIKSAGKWSTAKWEKYSAPEFPGYTPAPAQIDETTVNEETQDTTVEISYTANKTPEQPDQNGKQETKEITRTIIVHEPNGTDQTVIQKATLTRKVILDTTTGEIKSAGKWSTAKWEKYSAPEFPGYTPAPAQIDETTVNEETQDTTVEISYTANKTPEQPDQNGKQETKEITRTIIVHEPNGTDQTVIQKATVTRKVILDATTGEIKSAGKWSTAKWERYSAPEFKGYTPAPAQIDETTVNEETQDTTVEISYTANKTPEQPDQNGKQETKEITRTIIVHEPNGTDQTVIQTATVTRKVILDTTTGEIKSAGKWSTAKWEKYSAPEFPGYTPAPAQIDETTVNEETQDTTVEISYTANKTPEQPDQNGKQETKEITRTIIVHEPNGTDQTVIQKATVTRKVILDATTGEIKSAGKWSTAKWERYSAPEFKGYTPAPAQIDETTVNEDTQDTTVEISYTANKTPEQPDHNVDGGKTETKEITRTIIVHEPNGTDQTVIQKATVTRKVILDATTGEIKSAGKWSTAKWERYSAPEFKGYTPAPAQIDETTVNEDTQDTTVEISYTANKTPEQPDHNVDGGKTETKEITRTIIVHEPNGTDQTVIQKATVTRKVVLDATTGEIKSAGKWSTAKWERYSAPEFKGYTPAPAQIDETTVNEETQDTTVEISYTANKTPEQPDYSKDKDQGQNPQTPDSNENGKHHLSTGENTESSDSTTKTKAPATANKVTKNLPQTGENTESSGSTTKTKAPATANKVTKNLPQTGENTESSGSTTKTKVLATANKVTKSLPQTGENTESSGSTTKTKAPATANKVTKNLPQTGEKENQLGLLGIVLASLGVFGLGLGWKKREHE